jgi:hypothetical protein
MFIKYVHSDWLMPPRAERSRKEGLEEDDFIRHSVAP